MPKSHDYAGTLSGGLDVSEFHETLHHSGGLENAQSSCSTCFVLARLQLVTSCKCLLLEVGHLLIGWLGSQLEAQGPLRCFLDHAGSFRRV